MNLLADENVERQVVDRLRGELYIAETDVGASDDVIINRANDEEALLLTADKDFGEMIFRHKRLSTGVLLIRLAGLSNDGKAEMVSSAIRNHANELFQAFTVITPKMIRIRRKN